MKKGFFLFELTIFAGLLAGITRALQLAFAFDGETQLLEKHPSTTFLLCVVGVFTVVAVLLSARASKYEPGETEPPSALWLVIELAAAASLLFSSGYELYSLRESFHAVILIFNLLGVFAALSILVSAVYTRKGILTASTGFYYTVPIFWCCFALVLDFWSHSANPVILSFVFMMFALIFTALSTHAAAGYFFGRPRRRRSMAFCAFGVFFSLMTFVSLVAYPFFEESEATVKVAVTTPGTLTKLGFMILHLIALYCAVAGNALRRPSEAGPQPEAVPDGGLTPGLKGEAFGNPAEAADSSQYDGDTGNGVEE